MPSFDSYMKIANILYARMPPLLYEPEGEKIAERLWRETLDELAFANVAKIVDSLSK